MPLTAVESEETSPFTIEPTSIANHVARLLGGTPDLDIGQLGAMLDTAQDPALPLEDRITAIRWLARTGNDEAIDALGEGTPEAADLLLELARNADDPVKFKWRELPKLRYSRPLQAARGTESSGQFPAIQWSNLSNQHKQLVLTMNRALL